jgi:hypothetical protein
MSSRNIFVFGLPRSGTTWLGKIFDSQPDTVLIHEPDTIHSTNAFPFVMSSDEINAYLELACSYLLDRTTDRQLRCMSNTPYFRKNYRSDFSEVLRKSLIVLARGLDTLSRGRIERRVSIPDFASNPAGIINVVKSVDSVARLPLFAKACPDQQFVYIVRHPCGVTNSKFRGRKLGKLGGGSAFSAWLKFDLAIRKNLTEEDIRSWSSLQSNAWVWTLTNDFVLEMAKSLPNIMVLNYDRLCDSPMTDSKTLFERIGLPWNEQTEQYIRECMDSDPEKSVDYYSTQQNPAHAANRWKLDLSEEQKEEILSICANSENCTALLSSDKTFQISQ